MEVLPFITTYAVVFTIGAVLTYGGNFLLRRLQYESRQNRKQINDELDEILGLAKKERDQALLLEERRELILQKQKLKRLEEDAVLKEVLQFQEEQKILKGFEDKKARAAREALRNNTYTEHLSSVEDLFRTIEREKLTLIAPPDKKHLFRESSYGTYTDTTPAHKMQDDPEEEKTMSNITAEDLCLALGIALSSDPQLSIERQKDGSSILTFVQTKGAKPVRAHINLDVLND